MVTVHASRRIVADAHAGRRHPRLVGKFGSLACAARRFGPVGIGMRLGRRTGRRRLRLGGRWKQPSADACQPGDARRKQARIPRNGIASGERRAAFAQKRPSSRVCFHRRLRRSAGLIASVRNNLVFKNQECLPSPDRHSKQTLRKHILCQFLHNYDDEFRNLDRLLSPRLCLGTPPSRLGCDGSAHETRIEQRASA